MKNKKLVSVLIPTYNMGCFLDDAISSILNQTYDYFELIIVDNCSNDNTQKIVSKYLNDERIRYIINSENIGMARNWNKCLLESKGEYIKFLNADDLLKQNAIEEFVNILEEYPNVSIVTSKREIFGSKEGVIEPPYCGLINGIEAIQNSFEKFNWIGEPTSVIFRSKNLNFGLFNPALNWVFDWDMWLRQLLLGDLYVSEKILSSFRIHEAQGTQEVRKTFKDIFEEYEYYKFTLRINGLFIVKNKEFLIKQKAIRIGLTIHNFIISKRYDLVNEALQIIYAERVIIGVALRYIKKIIKKLIGK